MSYLHAINRTLLSYWLRLIMSQLRSPLLRSLWMKSLWITQLLDYFRASIKCHLSDIFSDLRTTRARLLEMFTDVTCNPEIMKNATDAYFSLLQGMITSFHLSVLSGFQPFQPPHKIILWRVRPYKPILFSVKLFKPREHSFHFNRFICKAPFIQRNLSTKGLKA